MPSKRDVHPPAKAHSEFTPRARLLLAEIGNPEEGVGEGCGAVSSKSETRPAQEMVSAQILGLRRTTGWHGSRASWHKGFGPVTTGEIRGCAKIPREIAGDAGAPAVQVVSSGLTCMMGKGIAAENFALRLRVLPA
jgi:hypothetical protein